MHRKLKLTAVFSRLCLLLMLVSCICTAAYAQGKGGGDSLSSGNSAEGNDRDTNKGTAFDIRKNYFLRYPVAREFGPTSSGGHDVIVDKKSIGPGVIVHCKSGPVQMWPVIIPCAVSNVPTKRDEGIMDDLFQTFGYPVSDTQFQVIQRYNDNRLLEQLFDPEKLIWLSNAIGNIQATSAANSTANLSRNQAVTAIDKVQQPLKNFTVEGGNKWNRIRDQLFVPMAILLLLPGAVLTQVKAIIAQGTPILGDANPFDGIIRSIVAIFLIPATYLVVNYGIDVSNSLKFTVESEYRRIFGSDMYKDAQCAQLKAFPINPAQTQKNAIDSKSEFTGKGDAFGKLESITFNITGEDPCAGNPGNQNKPDENANFLVSTGRATINGANTGLTASWNVLSAFQEAYLLYLWCMGPIVAALWVWPIAPLRGALSSWIEGVVTICFWSLFWSTSVLLMACFRNVDETGTVIMTALNFLVNASVKNAFDFSGLVRSAGAQASQAMQQAASKAAQAASGGGGEGGGGEGVRGDASSGEGGRRGEGGEEPSNMLMAGRSDLTSEAERASFDFGGGGGGGGGGLNAANVLGEMGSPPGDVPGGGTDSPTDSGPVTGEGPGGDVPSPPPLDGGPGDAAAPGADAPFMRAAVLDGGIPSLSAPGQPADPNSLNAGPVGPPPQPDFSTPSATGAETGIGPVPGSLTDADKADLGAGLLGDPTNALGVGNPLDVGGLTLGTGIASEVMGTGGNTLDLTSGTLSLNDSSGIPGGSIADSLKLDTDVLGGANGLTPASAESFSLTNTNPLQEGGMVNADTMKSYNDVLGTASNDDLAKQAFNDVAGIAKSPEEMKAFAADFNVIAQENPKAADAIAMAIHENPQAGMRLADTVAADIAAHPGNSELAKDIGQAYASAGIADNPNVITEAQVSFAHGLDSIAARGSVAEVAPTLDRYAEGMTNVMQHEGNGKYYADSVAYMADHSSRANTEAAIASGNYLAEHNHAKDVAPTMQAFTEAAHYDAVHHTNTAGELSNALHQAQLAAGGDSAQAAANMVNIAGDAHYLNTHNQPGNVGEVMRAYSVAAQYDAAHAGSHAVADMGRALDHAMQHHPGDVARIAHEVNSLSAHGHAQDIPQFVNNYNAAVSYDASHPGSSLTEQYSRAAEHVAQFNPDKAPEFAAAFQNAVERGTDPGQIGQMLQYYDGQAAQAAYIESGLNNFVQQSPGDLEALRPAIQEDPRAAYELASIANVDAAAYRDIVSHMPEHSATPQDAAAYVHQQYQQHAQQHPDQHPEIARSGGGFQSAAISGGIVGGATTAAAAAAFRRASTQSPQQPAQPKTDSQAPKSQTAPKEPTAKSEEKPKETAESLQEQFQKASDRAHKANAAYHALLNKKNRTEEEEEEFQRALEYLRSLGGQI